MKNCVLILWIIATSATAQEYSTCSSWDELVGEKEFKYVLLVRISDPGTKEQPAYTGFWFYDKHQFDVTGRYVLGMKVYFQNRYVEPVDRGDIGYIDLQDGFKWTKIGETTAWNWQQGCRLQWRPNSDEILWNDRSEDGTRFITFLRNMASPRHVSGWSVSADGRNVRYFYDLPSHHTWQDDSTILEGRYLKVFKDDGAGKVVQHLFLFHRPSKLFVPLARLKSTAEGGIHRVDLHQGAAGTADVHRGYRPFPG